MSDQPFRVFVGWDSREDIAYQICRRSILARASEPVEVSRLRQDTLRAHGLYWREADPLSSTEFTFTRFLVPHLAGYEGWALFCDCDFLWLGDISELVGLTDDRYAVICVHHDYRPPERIKMDGKIQTQYPRKNWSSMVLYNCGHPSNKVLTPDVVNRETGAFLHRFQWLDDSEIGAVPETWNWLEGWCQRPKGGAPNVIHYTRGGPWFENWQDVDYAREWLDEQEAWSAEGGQPQWDVLDFWFEETKRDRWFAKDATFDATIRDRFGSLYDRAVAGEFDHWRDTPYGCLAAVLLLGQFPQRMFRGDPRAGATEAKARAIAEHALEQGHDARLTPTEREFLYMPLRRSADMMEQPRSIGLSA